MEISMETMQSMTDAFRTANAKLQEMAGQLKAAEERLNDNTELLRQSNEDIKLLLAFIKSKGLQPPTIQSKFIN
jgi:hypothetical protein